MIPRTARKIRSQMARFSGKVSAGLCKAARRFVGEMVYGIQARQSVHLTEVGRSLSEGIALIKTENRLSRNLSRPELRPVLQGAILGEGSSRISGDTLLVLDLSDIVKPYAEKMECLARVRDGSTGELADGYWLCEVIGVENEGEEITPLYSELYSQAAPDFVSENDEILKAIGLVSSAVDGRGIWVIDRGGDRGELYKELVPAQKGRRFMIRQTGERHVWWGQKRLFVREAAARCSLPYATTVVREEGSAEKVYHLEYGFACVRLPAHPEVPLWLLVVRGFGQEPLMILTNVPLRKNRKRLWWAVSAYLTRWRIEETIRFAKQCYRVEDVRVLTYDRLRNLVVLVLVAMFFCAVVLGTKLKLKVLAAHAITAAKRLFGVPDFRYYALADGIREILSRFPRPPGSSSSADIFIPLLPLFDT
jgi:hypothetical protein